jgi:hypothetical protein
VGLTAYDIVTRFAPFSLRAFDYDAKRSHRATYTTYIPPEAPPNPTDDSLPDFGDGLDWTPARGPRGPPIKAKNTTTPGTSSSSGGKADANDTPMEV